MNSPEELETLARGHDNRAADLRAQVRRLAVTVASTEWEGPAANRARWENEDWSRAAERAASELEDIARGLRREAAALRAELAELARIERVVRTALSQGTVVMPDRLPPSGDPGWRQLAEQWGL